MYFRLFVLKWDSKKIQFDHIIGTTNFPARASIDDSTTDFITQFPQFLCLGDNGNSKSVQAGVRRFDIFLASYNIVF